MPIFILPNIAYALNEVWDISPQIWSIGAEEQFYIFWPLLFLLVIRERTLQYLILLIVFFTLLPFFFKFINTASIDSSKLYTIITRFFYGTKFNGLLTGALAGYIYFKNKDKIRNEKYNWIKTAITILPFVIWFFKFKLNHFNDELYCLLFSFSIYQITANSKIKIDSKITKFLGKISYGIYLYHWIIIILLIKYLPKIDNITLYNLELYLSVVSLTILTSWLSYFSYEKYFLNMKKNYEIDKI